MILKTVKKYVKPALIEERSRDWLPFSLLFVSDLK